MNDMQHFCHPSKVSQVRDEVKAVLRRRKRSSVPGGAKSHLHAKLVKNFMDRMGKLVESGAWMNASEQRGASKMTQQSSPAVPNPVHLGSSSFFSPSFQWPWAGDGACDNWSKPRF